MERIERMRIALIGAHGQLGTDLLKVFPEATPLSHQDIEITNPNSIERALEPIKPDLVINTAAYNLVDKAESDPSPALAVNAIGPGLLAEWCHRNKAAIVHYSTDYVFGLDAERTEPYTETDAPGPNSMYGISKLAGEYAVAARCPQHLIIRTCGLYGIAATRTKGNFVTTMLRLGKEHDELRIVSDQTCTPTFTADLAVSTKSLIDNAMNTNKDWGLYHITNQGQMSWANFAAEIFQRAKIDVDIVAITTAEFGAAAGRPPFSVLDTSRFEQVTGTQLPPWEDALDRYLQLLETSLGDDSTSV